MAAKKTVHALPRYMSAYERNGTKYKYQRRVPLALQEALALKKWDYSLGSDLTNAAAMCATYTKTINEMIERLSEDGAIEELERDTQSRVAAELAELTVQYENSPDLSFDGKNIEFADQVTAPGIKLKSDTADQELWRSTEETIGRAANMAPRAARDHLALFSAYAFGDKTHIDRVPANDVFGNKLVELLEPSRPADTTSGAIFDALKAALDSQIFELDGKVAVNSAYTLSELREKYFDLRAVAHETRKGYMTKTNSIIAKIGDLPLTHYTPDKLRKYRDELMADGLSARSIASYFTALKAIMRWALKEELVPGFDSLPTDKVTMPRVENTIEEIRWQRFDDAEIKKVWGLLQKGWGEESRLTEDRREAFKMVFRVLLYSGLRPVEVFRLTPEDVTPDFIHASKVKTKIPRTIPLSKHIADFYPFMQQDPFPFRGFGRAETVSGKMSDSFTKTIRAGGMVNPKHVLYSAKDTLVDRLQRAQRSEDVIRGITGHVSGQGHLRSYKTRLNDSPEGLLMLREALDAIEYW